MSKKVMVVSYNEIDGVPQGRYEKGNAIAYSAEWGWENFAKSALMKLLTGLPLFSPKAVQQATETALSNPQDMLVHDLPSVETVYVYVGLAAMEEAMTFIRKLQELKKVVHMVACDCNECIKIRFAKQLGIDIIWTGCGGIRKCGEIFAQHSV